MTSERGARDLVFVGDVHLRRDDPDLPAFLSFVRSLAGTAGTLVFAGDLFDLWLGGRDMELPHQRAVIDLLRELRRTGTCVKYLEGNRDFHVGATFTGDAFDVATDEGIAERCGGHRILAIHGDLANPADQRYLAWRRIARSRLTWGLFRVLPAGARIRAAEATERRMRRSNRAFKAAFPEAAVRTYAAGLLSGGHDTIVLGHFHVEKDLEVRGSGATGSGGTGSGATGRVLVLPEWKESRRHLRFGSDGSIRFEPSATS